MVKIKDIEIQKKREYPYDLGFLVSENKIDFKGEKEFQAKGLVDDARNRVFGSVARRAGKLGANLAIVEDEYLPKRSLYKATVHFYYDPIEERRPVKKFL